MPFAPSRLRHSVRKSTACRSGAVALACLALVGAACSDDASTSNGPVDIGPAPTSTEAPASTAPVTTQPLASIDLTFTHVATANQPVSLFARVGDEHRYIAEKGGRIRRLRPDSSFDPTPVLDLGPDVGNENEQGLLDAAFSPDGTRLYVHYNPRRGNTRLVEYMAPDGIADPSTARVLLEVDQPYTNHNGGELRFGPDGMLYLGLGDGGSAGDPHDNGQRLDTLLGKILRIDPTPGPNSAYTVPADNPFVEDPDARPEIWIYGVRNPWRFTFDPETNDLWVADVGQNQWEEVSFLRPADQRGANLGWNRVEGNDAFKGAAPSDAVAPALVLSHADGNCSITGGEVARETSIPGLEGTYLFADLCRGVLTGIRATGLDDSFETQTFPNAVLDAITGFGRGPDGSLYAVALAGGIHRIDAT